MRKCVDFIYLDVVNIKYPFPIPFMDNILEELVRQEMYSFMDGFSGYNQISIIEEDKLETTFVVEDGVYDYKNISFRSCNALATFR